MLTTKRPLAALAGVIFCLLGIAGTVAAGDVPDFVDAPATIAAYYVDEETAVLASSTLYLLAAVSLLIFAAFLRGVIARAEGADGTLAAAAYAGLVAGGACCAAGAAFGAAGALRAGEEGSIAPPTAAAVWDASTILYGLAAPMAVAVAVIAVAALSLRGALLPAWLGAVSAALGLALLIPPINYMAMIGFGFWCLLVGGLLYLRGAEVPLRQPPAAPA